MNCAKCGEPMRQTEKDTSSGRDIREYKCDRCGYEDWEDQGKALWQILHDDREEFEAAQAERAGPKASAAPCATEQAKAISRWSRIASLFRKRQ